MALASAPWIQAGPSREAHEGLCPFIHELFGVPQLQGPLLLPSSFPRSIQFTTHGTLGITKL